MLGYHRGCTHGLDGGLELPIVPSVGGIEHWPLTEFVERITQLRRICVPNGVLHPSEIAGFPESLYPVVNTWVEVAAKSRIRGQDSGHKRLTEVEQRRKILGGVAERCALEVHYTSKYLAIVRYKQIFIP